MCVQMNINRVVQTHDGVYCFDVQENLYRWRGVHAFSPIGLGVRVYRDHWQHVPEKATSAVRDRIDADIVKGQVVWMQRHIHA